MIGKNTAPINAVACWGDSLTSTSSTETQLSASAGSYPNQLRKTSAGRPVLARSYPGQNAQFVTAKALMDKVLRDWTSVYWAGTNNIATLPDPVSTVLSAAHEFVSHLSHDRFLILPPLAPSNFHTGHVYSVQRQDISDALQAAFPANFVDIFAELLAAGPAGNSTDGGSSVGSIHSSLRLDVLHLNDAGNSVVKTKINAVLTAKGW